MSEQFDAIVVGGGPGGSTVATFLSRMGRRVLLLEREFFPRHHIGESMIAATLDILAEIGLEDTLAAAGFPVKSGGCFIWGRSTEPWCIRFDEIPGRATSYQVKRSVFDKLLLDHSAASGVDVRQGHRVIDVVVRDGRVCGVRSRDAAGVEHTCTARFVIDASGLAAVVAGRTSPRVPAEDLKNVCLYGYWSGTHPAPAALGGEIRPHDRNNIIIKMIDDGWLWFIPLGRPAADGDGPPEISVGFVTPRANLPDGVGRAELERHYLQRVRTTPEWQYLLRDATYRDDFHTIKDWSYRTERMAGPGYFAVGDASCFVDPILSSGVFLAVLYGKMCAIAVNTLLTTSAPEALVREWYQGLYVDTYTDYLEMARHWYHGLPDRDLWMDRAKGQLLQEEQPVFAETKRDAFIALATGNTHAHPHYVLVRRLESFPVPLYLRKDARTGHFKDMRNVLFRHGGVGAAPPAPDSGPAVVWEQTAEERKRMLSALRGNQSPPVTRFSAPPHVACDLDAPLVLSSRTRTMLEAVDQVVTLVLRAPTGERRHITWPEQPLFMAFAAGRSPRHAAHELGLEEADVAAFCAEMLASGVLVRAAVAPSPAACAHAIAATDTAALLS